MAAALVVSFETSLAVMRRASIAPAPTLGRRNGVLRTGSRAHHEITTEFKSLTSQRSRVARQRWDGIRHLVSKKKRNRLGHVQERLRVTLDALNKEPSQRSVEDVAMIYRWIVSQSSVPLFAGMSEFTSKTLCREMRYRKYQRTF